MVSLTFWFWFNSKFQITHINLSYFQIFNSVRHSEKLYFSFQKHNKWVKKARKHFDKAKSSLIRVSTFMNSHRLFIRCWTKRSFWLVGPIKYRRVIFSFLSNLSKWGSECRWDLESFCEFIYKIFFTLSYPLFFNIWAFFLKCWLFFTSWFFSSVSTLSLSCDSFNLSSSTLSSIRPFLCYLI